MTSMYSDVRAKWNRVEFKPLSSAEPCVQSPKTRRRTSREIYGSAHATKNGSDTVTQHSHHE